MLCNANGLAQTSTFRCLSLLRGGCSGRGAPALSVERPLRVRALVRVAAKVVAMSLVTEIEPNVDIAVIEDPFP